jgi:hypothetical protein
MPLTVRWIGAEDLDARTLAAWTELGGQALHPSPFLMPQFLLPAARWLSPRRPVFALFERPGRVGHELVGAGAFSVERPTPFVPVPHLRGYCTLHSFRTGLLVAPGEASAVAQALLATMHAPGVAHGHALTFRNVLDSDEAFTALRRAALLAGGNWFELGRFARPVWHLAAEHDPAAAVPRRMLKNLRRHRRRLHEHGPYATRVVQDAASAADAAERHLVLEHSGWKGARGSALLSTPAGAGFFREMVERFQRIGAAVFVELCLDGRVIGSSSNFLVGRTLSAFKIGWHPDFARFSPGRLTELALFESMAGAWPHVDKFDSNSQQDSFLSDMLPHAEPIVTGFLGTSRWGACALGGARLVRPLARALGGDPWRLRAR